MASSQLLPLVADAIARATIVLGATGLAAAALRRAPAAARHLVWTLGLLSALAIPVLSIAMPRLALPIVRVAGTAPAPAVSSAPTTDEMTSVTAPLLRHRTGQATAPDRPISVPGQSVLPPAITPAGALLLLWALGATVMLGRLLLGMAAVAWTSRRTPPVTDAPWLPLARSLAASLGLTGVAFQRSASATMPMACGIFGRTVLMPADADSWPDQRLRMVLLHELAHVQRRDCLTHALAQLACAAYWFNPLAWMAARHLRIERERACDDLVLAAGTRGSDYADQLLEIARLMHTGRFQAALGGATLAMAHRSQLEGRLMAILDPSVPRTGLSGRRFTIAAATCALLLVPVASIQPWVVEAAAVAKPLPAEALVPMAVSPAVPQPAVPQQPTPAPAPPSTQAPAPTALPAPTPSPAQIPVPTPRPSLAIDVDPALIANLAAFRELGRNSAAIQEIVRDIAQGVREGIAAGVEGGVSGGVELGVAGGVSGGVGSGVGAGVGAGIRGGIGIGLEPGFQKAKDKDKSGNATLDPRAVNALIDALKDSDVDVRETAMSALAQLRDLRAVEPLISALKDENAEIRELAAFALGQLRDLRAIEALVVALKDSVADVREQVAFALGQLHDARAIDGLTAALKDANPNVRQQAAFALGQIR